MRSCSERNKYSKHTLNSVSHRIVRRMTLPAVMAPETTVADTRAKWHREASEGRPAVECVQTDATIIHYVFHILHAANLKSLLLAAASLRERRMCMKMQNLESIVPSQPGDRK